MEEECTSEGAFRNEPPAIRASLVRTGGKLEAQEWLPNDICIAARNLGALLRTRRMASLVWRVHSGSRTGPN